MQIAREVQRTISKKGKVAPLKKFVLKFMTPSEQKQKNAQASQSSKSVWMSALGVKQDD